MRRSEKVELISQARTLLPNLLFNLDATSRICQMPLDADSCRPVTLIMLFDQFCDKPLFTLSDHFSAGQLSAKLSKLATSFDGVEVDIADVVMIYSKCC